MSKPELSPASAGAAASSPAEENGPEGGRIGVYRVEGRLGQGGMGEVFLGYDDRLDRRVAIKRIRHGARTTSEQRERFRREARAVARLSHPSIVQVYDLLEDGSGDCIVLEFVAGRTLREMLARGPLDPATAVQLARQIAEGLAAAHEAGLVHRDLKAENVVVTPAGQAKILDFGLAKPVADDASAEPLTEHGTVLGTSHAMSPEQASGGDVDARSDLFSLGVLLYEMLTSLSPFRGVNVLDTLKRVLTLHPPPPRAIRPDVSAALDSLVMALLAKDRERRPPSAGAVLLALEKIARLPLLSSPPAANAAESPSSAFRISNLRTGESPLPWSPVAPPPKTARTPLRRRATLAAILASLLAPALYFAARGPAAPLRVVVASPALIGAAGDEPLALVASGVLGALLGGLASFEGIAPLDPSQLGGTQGAPTDLARAVAADEVLSVSVERADGLCRVSLRRIQGKDGRVLWADTFDVPAGAGDLRLVADAVRVQLRRAYEDPPLRLDVPDLDVRDEDYAAFLAVKRRLDPGTSPLESELPQLEAILRSSPRFLEAHLQAAKVAHNLFQSTREVAYLDRAAAFVQEAERLAPGDPRPLVDRFRIDLARGRDEEAESALDRLARLVPGDPDILVLRAQLAERRGRMDEAVAGLRAAVERAPSWRNLFRLADLEYKDGRMDDARGHLEMLLDRAPGNLWGLQKLAEVELMAGDLARAERIYLDLIRQAPVRSNYTNLGLARFLSGRNDQAVAAYRKALELDPGHVTVTINLADAERARGREHEARALYTQALAALQAQEEASPLSPFDQMLKAQCAAHLGQARAAVRIVQQTVAQSPRNPEVLYLASLVYALVGERTSSLVHAQNALEQGVQPRWFSIHPLSRDPELQNLLAQR